MFSNAVFTLASGLLRTNFLRKKNFNFFLHFLLIFYPHNHNYVDPNKRGKVRPLKLKQYCMLGCLDNLT